VKKGKAEDRKAKEEAAMKRLNEKYKYLLPENLSGMKELPVEFKKPQDNSSFFSKSNNFFFFPLSFSIFFSF
jgi:hypothetical protein